MGTLGKALGASGGYICGSRALIDFLVNRARTFHFFAPRPCPPPRPPPLRRIQFRCNRAPARSAETSSGNSSSAGNRRVWFDPSPCELGTRDSPEERPAEAPSSRDCRRRNAERWRSRRPARAGNFRSRHSLSDRRARLRPACASRLTAAHSAEDVESTGVRALQINRESSIVNRPMHRSPTRSPLRLASVHPDARLAQARADRHRRGPRRGACAMFTAGEYLDANSSIWTNLHGHNHPKINAAIQRQLRKIAHSSALGLRMNRRRCWLAELVEAANRIYDLRFASDEKPAKRTRKSKIANRRLEKVFFSDDGSTAMEVALKLAYEFARRTRGPQPRAAVPLARRRVSRRHGGRGLARPH